MKLPDLSVYKLDRVVNDAHVWGVRVPDLRASFYSRSLPGERVETAGVYTYDEAEIFLAWGFADEVHCTAHAFRTSAGWEQPRRGCPRVRAVKVGAVTGILLRARSGDRLLKPEVSAARAPSSTPSQCGSLCAPTSGSPPSWSARSPRA